MLATLLSILDSDPGLVTPHQPSSALLSGTPQFRSHESPLLLRPRSIGGHLWSE